MLWIHIKVIVVSFTLLEFAFTVCFNHHFVLGCGKIQYVCKAKYNFNFQGIMKKEVQRAFITSSTVI